MSGHRGLLLFAGLAFSLLGGRCYADSVVAELTGASPADIVYLSYTGTAAPDFSNLEVYAGQLQWKVLSGNSPVVPVGSTFGTYCVDIVHDIYIGDPYSYNIVNGLSSVASVQDSVDPTLVNSELQTLWYYDYAASTSGATPQEQADNSAAFQIDVWRILYGVNDLTATAINQQESGWITTANDWLSDLQTETPQTVSGLYAMQGEANAEYPDGQDQGIMEATPLPRAALAGVGLLAVLGLTRLRVRALAAVPAAAILGAAH